MTFFLLVRRLVGILRGSTRLPAHPWVVPVLALAFTAVSPFDARADSSWTTGPLPGWIRATVPSTVSRTADWQADSNGQHFIAYDREVRVSSWQVESFSHWSRCITNEAGLQAGSHIDIEFDAS